MTFYVLKQFNKAQNGLEKTQEEVARLQVEYERVQEKQDRAQRELRQATGDLEKFKVDNMSLQSEVERFAARMGKYQVRSRVV